MLFISLALSLMLVVLIVIALKNNQQRRLEELADREQSLPPLHSADTQQPAQQPTQQPETRESACNDTHPDPATTFSAPEHGAPSIQNDDPDQPATDWKQLCREYRQTRQFEQALAAADRGWPQAQSYEQIALTIRAAIKQTPPGDSHSMQAWLTRLHRAAAESSLLHDKLPEDGSVQHRNMTEQLTRETICQVELPWQDIGSEQLRLLTKTDRRLMAEYWGEPKQHISAKHWYHRNSET